MDYVDLYLIHWPLRVRKNGSNQKNVREIQPEDFLPLDLVGTWEAMEKCCDLGLAKAIGVSNFSVKKLENLLPHVRYVPAVNQVTRLQSSALSHMLTHDYFTLPCLCCLFVCIAMIKTVSNTGGDASDTAPVKTQRLLQAKWNSSNRMGTSGSTGYFLWGQIRHRESNYPGHC